MRTIEYLATCILAIVVMAACAFGQNCVTCPSNVWATNAGYVQSYTPMASPVVVGWTRPVLRTRIVSQRVVKRTFYYSDGSTRVEYPSTMTVAGATIPAPFADPTPNSDPIVGTIWPDEPMPVQTGSIWPSGPMPRWIKVCTPTGCFMIRE